VLGRDPWRNSFARVSRQCRSKLDARQPLWPAGRTLGQSRKTLTLNTKIAGVAVEFSCTGISLDSGLIETEGKSTGKALFSGCKTKLNGSVSAACEPFTGAGKGLIASNALKGQLLLHEGTTTLLKVSAVTGETLGTIEMSELCSIGEKVPVIGPGLYVKDAGGEFETEKEVHQLEVGPLTELWTISKTTEQKRQPVAVSPLA
jgi:hypothetical protein